MKTITISDETYAKLQSEIEALEKPTTSFDAQLNTYIGKSYHAIVGLPEQEFRDLCEPARKAFGLVEGQKVLVIPSCLVPLRRQLQALDTKYYWAQPEKVRDLAPTSHLPYVVAGIDTKEYRGVSVQDARKKIAKAGRHALTATEVAALVLHFPDSLEGYPNYHFIDAAGSEYPDADGDFSESLFFVFRVSRVGFGCGSLGYADGGFGSASGFLPQLT